MLSEPEMMITVMVALMIISPLVLQTDAENAIDLSCEERRTFKEYGNKRDT